MMDSLEELAAHMRRLREMQEQVPFLVNVAREDGASWSDVGRALGTTRQAAWQRYGLPEVRPAHPPWRLAGR